MSCPSVLGDYLTGYLIKGTKESWAGPVASRKGGICSVRTTFYEITKVRGPLRPRSRAGLPGGGSPGVCGCPSSRERLPLPAGMGRAVVGVSHGEGNLTWKRGTKQIKLFFLKQKQL